MNDFSPKTLAVGGPFAGRVIKTRRLRRNVLETDSGSCYYLTEVKTHASYSVSLFCYLHEDLAIASSVLEELFLSRLGILPSRSSLLKRLMSKDPLPGGPLIGGPESGRIVLAPVSKEVHYEGYNPIVIHEIGGGKPHGVRLWSAVHHTTTLEAEFGGWVDSYRELHSTTSKQIVNPSPL